MPLSKNLYEINDLAAFLLLSLEKPNLDLSLAILNELTASFESELVYKLLTFAWLLSTPDKECTPLRYTTLRSRRYDMFLATYTHNPLVLTPCISIDAYPMITVGNYRKPKEWYATPQGWTEDQCGTLYHHVQQAIRNKQCWRAYLLSRPLLNHPPALLSFLGAIGVSVELLAFATYEQLRPRILEHAMYSLAYPPAPMEIMNQPIHSAGRFFTIPPDARNRWNVPPQPPTKLLGQPNFIFDDSSYWNTQRNIYQIDIDAKGHIRYESEQLYQDFFQHNFPIDIPDEWSVEERTKSHGGTYMPQPNSWVPTFAALLIPTEVSVSR